MGCSFLLSSAGKAFRYFVISSNGGSTYGISVPVTTLTSNAALSSSNYDTITATAPAPASLCRFYRSVGTGSNGIRGINHNQRESILQVER